MDSPQDTDKNEPNIAQLEEHEFEPAEFSTWKRGCHCRAKLRDEKDVLEFRNIPINSWIPLLLLSTTCLVVGIILARYMFQQYWYMTLVLWVFSGLFLAKVKYEKYTFDKSQMMVEILTVALTGRFMRRIPLEEVAEIEMEKTRDAQGGDDVELFMRLANGRRIKLLSGQFCGVQTSKFKSQLRKELIAFFEGVDHKSIGSIPREATIRPSMQVDRINTSTTSVYTTKTSTIRLSSQGLQSEKPLITTPAIVVTAPPPTDTGIRVQDDVKNFKTPTGGDSFVPLESDDDEESD